MNRITKKGRDRKRKNDQRARGYKKGRLRQKEKDQRWQKGKKKEWEKMMKDKNNERERNIWTAQISPVSPAHELCPVHFKHSSNSQIYIILWIIFTFRLNQTLDLYFSVLSTTATTRALLVFKLVLGLCSWFLFFLFALKTHLLLAGVPVWPLRLNMPQLGINT